MNNRLFGLNRSKVCRVLRIAAVICWWGSTLPFICHILAGFTTPLYPESYRYTLIPYPVAFRIAAAGYWLSQIALFYGCGVAVLKSNIRLLRFFCLAAIVPQILRIIYARYMFSAAFHESTLWICLLVLSIIWLMNAKDDMDAPLAMLLLTAAPLVSSRFRSYDSPDPALDNWRNMLLISFEIEGWLRTFSILFTGLFLTFLPSGSIRVSRVLLHKRSRGS